MGDKLRAVIGSTTYQGKPIKIYPPPKEVFARLAEVQLRIRDRGYEEEVLGRNYFALAALGEIAEGCTDLLEVIKPPEGAETDAEDPFRWLPWQKGRDGLRMVADVIETWDKGLPHVARWYGFAYVCLERVAEDVVYEEGLLNSARGKRDPQAAELAEKYGRAAAAYRPELPSDFYEKSPPNPDLKRTPQPETKTEAGPVPARRPSWVPAICRQNDVLAFRYPAQSPNKIKQGGFLKKLKKDGYILDFEKHGSMFHVWLRTEELTRRLQEKADERKQVKRGRDRSPGG